MTREITMQSVFFEGFKAAYRVWIKEGMIGAPGEPTEDEQLQTNNFFRERNVAWLDYVKELEGGK